MVFPTFLYPFYSRFWKRRLLAREKILNLNAARDSVGGGLSRVRQKPLQLYLELVTVCNLRCIMCAIVWDPRRKPGHGRVGYMDLSLIKKIEPMLSSSAVCIITGTGEPMMHPQFLEIIELLKRSGCWIGFNTNATFLDQRMAEGFLEAELDALTISIDGATKDTFEQIRKGASFPKVLSNVRNLVKLKRARRCKKPKIEFEMVLMKDNVHEMPLLVDLARDLDIEAIIFEPVSDNLEDPNYHEFFLQQNIYNLPAQQLDEIVFQTKEKAASLSITLRSRLFETNGASPVTPKLTESRICTEPWTTSFVTWDGKVRTCCFNDVHLGDLKTDPFDSIWNGVEYQGFRSAFSRNDAPRACEQCIQNGTPRRILPQIEEILRLYKIKALLP